MDSQAYEDMDGTCNGDDARPYDPRIPVRQEKNPRGLGGEFLDELIGKKGGLSSVCVGAAGIGSLLLAPATGGLSIGVGVVLLGGGTAGGCLFLND